MKNSRRLLFLLLIVIVILELIASWTGNHTLEYFVKPLIMVWMAVYFVLFAKKRSNLWMILMAFFFSWLGDILLMFSYKVEVLFYAGVGGFFLSQLSYILVFTRYFESPKKGFVTRKPLILIPYILYLVGIIILLFPGLEGIMRPIIIVYGASLIGMALAVVNLKGKVLKSIFSYIFLGSILFLLSDSMIAIDKFHTELPQARVLIMSTYMAAQFLILMGLANHLEEKG